MNFHKILPFLLELFKKKNDGEEEFKFAFQVCEELHKWAWSETVLCQMFCLLIPPNTHKYEPQVVRAFSSHHCLFKQCP